jgi:hypothetical protein
MKPSVFLSAVVAGLLALPAVAAAQDQPWLKDRRYTEGPGYRVGDFELHPGAALEFGYDSNYLRRASTEDPLGSLRLRLTPSLSFSTLGAQRREGGPAPSVEFRGGVSLTYNEFFPIQGSTSQKTQIQSQRNLGGNLDLALNILPGRAWSGVLTAGISRQLTASEQGLNTSFGSQGTFNRDIPRFGAELVWTPGAGLFEWRLGASATGTLFESLTELTNINAQVETRGRWRFLPRTSLLFDGRFNFITYPNAAGGTLGKTSSHPMRAMLGINGLVTQSFAILAMAGWGASFYSGTATTPSENFDSVIGQAELKWYLTPNASNDPGVVSPNVSAISVGFLRDFYDSYIGSYFERDRGYASLSYLYNGRFLVVVDGGAGPTFYPKIPNLGVNNSFAYIRVDASVFGEYRFKDWLGVNATFRYNDNLGSQGIQVSGGMTNSLAWREIEAYLGVRWLM